MDNKLVEFSIRTSETAKMEIGIAICTEVPL